jgi:hypothetical protein
MADAVDATGYMAGIAERTRMSRAWTVFLERYPLVLSPFLMRPTYPWNYDVQGFEQTKDLFDAVIYSYSINYPGLPAGVVPVGLVEGLPAGVQLVGRRFREDTILDAMAMARSMHEPHPSWLVEMINPSQRRRGWSPVITWNSDSESHSTRQRRAHRRRPLFAVRPTGTRRRGP